MQKDLKEISTNEFVESLQSTNGKTVSLTYIGNVNISNIYDEFKSSMNQFNYCFWNESSENGDWYLPIESIKQIFKNSFIDGFGTQLILELINDDKVIISFES